MKARCHIVRRQDHPGKSLDHQQSSILINPAGQLAVFVEVNTMEFLREGGRKACGLDRGAGIATLSVTRRAVRERWASRAVCRHGAGVQRTAILSGNHHWTLRG